MSVLCDKKLQDVVGHSVLRDINANGSTKKRFKYFPPRHNAPKASKKTGKAARELHQALSDIAEKNGKATGD